MGPDLPKPRLLLSLGPGQTPVSNFHFVPKPSLLVSLEACFPKLLLSWAQTFKTASLGA